MGTLVKMTVESRDPDQAERAIAAAFGRIRALDWRLSNYRAESEVNRFDAGHVSDDLRPPFELAMRLRRETESLFDVTQTALFDLWRAARRAKRLPTEMEIRAARAAADGKRLDLGGIAKGYAADEAVKVLRGWGERRVLVAVSGDLVAGDGRAWRIGLDSVGATTELRQAGVSTSGDAEQYLEAGGRRYSHIVNPKTGLGLTNGVVASVKAKSGMLADALATVVCLLGATEGRRLVRRYGAEVWTR